MERLMTKGGKLAVFALAMLLMAILSVLAGYQATQAQDDGSGQATGENRIFLPRVRNEADTTSIHTSDRNNSYVSETNNDENPSSPNDTPETEANLLLDAIDMASFGDIDVQVLVPEHPFESISTVTTTTNFLPSWQEARLTTLVVQSKTTQSSVVMLIDSISYNSSFR